MKTMTCRQLGGACDLELRGDTAHEPALSDMKGRWKHPIKGMGWYKDTKKSFAALPED